MKRRLICCWLMLSAAGLSYGENWPQWRGPFFNGATTETNLPSHWSKTENVAWTAPLPGYSGATPIIWDDSVFVSSPAGKDLLLICLDRSSGAERWRKTAGTGNKERGLNNMASPSPVTDGHCVVALFGTGTLAAYDFLGNLIWSRELAKEYGEFANMWLYASSPMLYRGRLYIQALQQNPPPPDYGLDPAGRETHESFLLCIDPKTGKNLWRHIRPTDALEESQESYTTPIPIEAARGTEILVAGGDYLTAHAPLNGEEYWRCGGLDERRQRHWRMVPSPVPGAGLIFACGPRRDPVLAIRTGGQGLVSATHIAWRTADCSSDCVTPLFYQGRLLVLDGDRHALTCLDPAGNTVWKETLGVREIFRASPTGADGKVYCVSEKGTVVVLDAGEQCKVLSTIRLDQGPVRSSIAAAHGRLFIRTARNLYCIGKL